MKDFKIRLQNKLQYVALNTEKQIQKACRERGEEDLSVNPDTVRELDVDQLEDYFALSPMHEQRSAVDDIKRQEAITKSEKQDTPKVELSALLFATTTAAAVAIQPTGSLPTTIAKVCGAAAIFCAGTVPLVRHYRARRAGIEERKSHSLNVADKMQENSNSLYRNRDGMEVNLTLAQRKYNLSKLRENDPGAVPGDIYREENRWLFAGA